MTLNLACVRRLTVGYHGRQVVGDVTFSLDERQSLLVLGHNGAGKTTLLRSFFGLLPPLGGDVTVLGLSEDQLTPARLITAGARFLGQGNRGFSDLTVNDSRRVLKDLYGLDAVTRKTFTKRPEAKRIGELSSGQRRLEALYLLAAGSPRLYVLDEPTAAADPRARSLIVRWIEEMQASGASFIIAEHAHADFLRLVERVLVIRSGQVTFYGEPWELLNAETLLETYL